LTDMIDTLCEKYGFYKKIKEDKDYITKMILHMYRAYEYYYGPPSSPPIDLIKEWIKLLIQLSPEAVNLRMETEKEIWDRCINRVVEKIYKTAEKELVKTEEMAYIA